MKIVSFAQMEELERLSQDSYLIPWEVTMEAAGFRLWERFRRDFSGRFPSLAGEGATSDGETPAMLFLAGRGRNGGDALVMARTAWCEGFREIKVVLMTQMSALPDRDQAEPGGGAGATGGYNPLTRLQLSICQRLGIPIEVVEPDALSTRLEEADVVFDGMVGIGLHDSLRPNLKKRVELLNGSSPMVVALDLPTGLGEHAGFDGSAVRATATYTVGLPKIALYTPLNRPYCGRIAVVKPGFPGELKESASIRGELVDWYAARTGTPLPGGSAHKGIRGHLGVFAGSTGTLGASGLAAEAGGRSGAGLVTLHIDSDLYTIAGGIRSGVMVRPQPPGKLSIREGLDTLLVGPGWGREGRSQQIRELLQSGLPGVLDADGITLAHQERLIPRDGSWILTPHPGEMSRIMGVPVRELQEKPLYHCCKLAEEIGATILFKSNTLFVVAPDGEFRVIDGMNQALATGGSGDLLAGVVAGLLTAGVPQFEAAWRAAALHQEAGRRIRKRCGWFMAEDLLPEISRLVDEMEQE